MTTDRTAVIARLGVAPDSRAAREGIALEVDGEAVLVLRLGPPSMSFDAALLETTVAAVTPERWPGVAAAVRAVAPDRRLVVRLAPDTTDVSPDLQRVLMRVERTPRRDASAPDTGTTLEPADLDDPDTRAFVLELLARSTAGGMGREDEMAHIRRFWHGRLALDTSACTARAYTARLDGDLIAHLTASQEVDLFTGEPYMLLHDAYTLEAHHGRGVAKALTAMFERDVADTTDLPIRGGVVLAAGIGGGEQILSALVASGWQPVHAWWAAS